MQEQNEKKNEARNLYFQTALSQAQIAEIIGVSQKTVSIWINDGKWKLLKDRTEQSPVVMIEQMVSELQEIHCAIAARPRGQRFPTKQEAEIRRKIMLSIKSLQVQQTAGMHAEMLTNFINYVCRHNIDDGKLLVQYADKYLMGELQFAPIEPYSPYKVPGELPGNNDDAPTPSGPDIPPSPGPASPNTGENWNKTA